MCAVEQGLNKQGGVKEEFLDAEHMFCFALLSPLAGRQCQSFMYERTCTAASHTVAHNDLRLQRCTTMSMSFKIAGVHMLLSSWKAS